jgi:hypothetical protein
MGKMYKIKKIVLKKYKISIIIHYTIILKNMSHL